MKLPFGRKPTTREKIVAGAMAGAVSSGAYAVMQQIDIPAFDYPTDDFVLLGRLFTDNETLIQPIGMAMHFVNGSLLGAAYALVARDRLPGTPLVKGFTWTMMETFGLYPMVFFENLHPGVREGRLRSYLSGKGFAQQILRHIAYGVVLGPATERFLRH